MEKLQKFFGAIFAICHLVIILSLSTNWIEPLQTQEEPQTIHNINFNSDLVNINYLKFSVRMNFIDKSVLGEIQRPDNGENVHLALGPDKGLGEDRSKTAADIGKIIVERKKWGTISNPTITEDLGEVVKSIPIESSPFSLWLTMPRNLRDKYWREMQELYPNFVNEIYVDPDTASNQTFWAHFSKPELYWVTIRKFSQAVGKQNPIWYIMQTEVIRMKCSINYFFDSTLDRKRAIITYCPHIDVNPAFSHLRKFLRARNIARKNNWVKLSQGKKDEISPVPELDLDHSDFLINKNWVGTIQEAEQYKTIWVQNDTEYLNKLNKKRLGYDPRRVNRDIQNYFKSENLKASGDPEKYTKQLGKWAEDKLEAVDQNKPDYSGNDPKILALKNRVKSALKGPLFLNQTVVSPNNINNRNPSTAPTNNGQNNFRTPQTEKPVEKPVEQTSFAFLNYHEETVTEDQEKGLKEQQKGPNYKELPSDVCFWKKFIAELPVSSSGSQNATKIIYEIFKDGSFDFKSINSDDFEVMLEKMSFETSLIKFDTEEEVATAFENLNNLLPNLKKLEWSDFENYLLKAFKSCKNTESLNEVKNEIWEHLNKRDIEKLTEMIAYTEALESLEDKLQLSDVESTLGVVNKLVVPITKIKEKTDCIEKLLSMKDALNKKDAMDVKVRANSESSVIKSKKKRSRSKRDRSDDESEAVECQEANLVKNRRKSQRLIDSKSNKTV